MAGVILGIAILALGALNLTVHLNDIKLSELIHTLPIVLMVIGSIIFIISFFGCCGALIESRCMILTFAALIVILFIVELLGGIAFYSFYNKEALSDSLKNSLKYYDTDKDVKKFWDVVHYDLHCCGINSYLDWESNIPNSCCRDIDVNDVCHSEHAYETGCLDEMLKYFKVISPIFFPIIVVLQLFAIIFSFCLGRQKNYQII